MIFMPIITGLVLPVAHIALFTLLVSKIDDKTSTFTKLAFWGSIAVWIFVWLQGYNRIHDDWDYGLFESISNLFFSLFTLPWTITTGLEVIFSLETGTLGGWP